MDNNDATLDAYENNIQAYIDATPAVPSDGVKVWIDHSLSLANKSLPILELGSGPGRDAAYIEARGYSIVRTDATKAFVRALIDAGHQAKVLNALTDDLGGPYGMVFANAVLLHFTPEQMERVLLKCYDSLLAGGILAITLKRGEGSEWRSNKLNAPRFFQYWTPEPLSVLLKACGFDPISLKEWHSSRSNIPWLHVIAQKPGDQIQNPLQA